jgi:mono/diheme cytochrome c family protein
MCESIDIIANETFDNNLGIEAENSHYILIEANYVHDNGVGIPVVIIPGLQTKTAADVIVRNNTIVNNNSSFFVKQGDASSFARAGRGISITAVDRVTVEGNIIKGNQTCGICISSMSQMGAAFPADAAIEPEPDEVRIFGNIFVNNGYDASGLGVAGAALEEGADIVHMARGNNHCYAGKQGAKRLGTSRWHACDPALSTAAIRSYRLDRPVESPTLSLVQKAQLTYHAVCSGCHAYGHNLIGPPTVVIKTLYQDNPEGLAEWIAAPTKKRPADEYPAMPPQDYLSEELRLELAHYILNEVGGS